MFQPIYKTFKMPAGLTDTIMKWDLKGCQMKKSILLQQILFFFQN